MLNAILKYVFMEVLNFDVVASQVLVKGAVLPAALETLVGFDFSGREGGLRAETPRDIVKIQFQGLFPLLAS